MKKTIVITLATFLALVVSACGIPSGTAVPSKASASYDGTEMTPMDRTYVKKDGISVIYVAGGCFWGTEKLMQTIHGVIDATSGYANGDEGHEPSYETVADTGFKETVRVEYDPAQVSLDAILFAYYRSIDPTITNRQGNDVGTQYQAGVYWADDAAKDIVERIAEVEKSRVEEFAVEIEPLRSFYDAEEYHQNYLIKNYNGYCHISDEEFELAANMIVDPALYPMPSAEEIEATLTDEQFRVTQEGGTEYAFQNEYWDNHERGLYVDVVTGEPLFSSSDKYDSGTGWPSFTKGIDENTFVYFTDATMSLDYAEVRSRTGNTHLGHVFYNESSSPSGERYCINSAALRFIPYAEMEKEGYGYLVDYVL